MNECLWLLPVVAVGVWLFVRVQGERKGAHKSGSGIPPEYLKGLDFLIDRRHDKATEIFIELVEAESDTVETHVVLGNLFRQKGEIERAIRIHQNIARFPRPGRYYTARSLLELGRDYFSAGLLDRAEGFFKQALSVDIDSIKLETYPHLLSLYEIEKNWQQAIEVAEKLKKSGEDCQGRISHYYCELAEQALVRGEYEEAGKLLVQAGSADKTSLRVMMIWGDLDFERGRVASAERQYLKAFEAYPQYARLLLPKIRKTVGHLSASEFSDYLEKLRPKVSSATYLLDFCESLLDAGRINELEAFFSDLIEQRRIPLSVIRLYLERKIKSGVSDKRLIASIIESLHVNEHPGYAYRCTKCGFEAHRFYWYCPGCHSWNRAYPQDVFRQPERESEGGLGPVSS